MPRRFRRNDEAVSEVIGFVLSFAISAVFLMIALSTFFSARNNSDDVVTAAEIKAISDRVAARIVEAGLIGQEFPNATLNLTLDIPQDANGHPYIVEARSDSVLVRTLDLPLEAKATTFKLEAVRDAQVSGFVYSSNERLVITYSLQGTRLDIHIHDEE